MVGEYIQNEQISAGYSVGPTIKSILVVVCTVAAVLYDKVKILSILVVVVLIYGQCIDF